MEKIVKKTDITSSVIRIAEVQSKRIFKKPNHLKTDLSHVTPIGDLQKIRTVLKEHSVILDRIDSGVKTGNKQHSAMATELKDVKELLQMAQREIERNSVSRFMVSLSLVFLGISIAVLLSVLISGALVLTSLHAFILIIVSFAFLIMAKLSKGISNGHPDNN